MKNLKLLFFYLQPDDCKRLWCTDSTSKSNACKTLHMPWADGTKCAEGMVRLTLSHCLIKVSVSISLSPSLSLSLSFQKTPPYFSLSLQLPSTSHPYPHLFMLTDWAKMERPSTDTWTIFLPIGFGFWSWNHFIAHIFSNLWHIPSLIYRIKGKFKKHLCTFNYLSFYRHS